MGEERLECPRCGSESVARILWGMPAFTPEVESGLKDGSIVLGGCEITSENPPALRCGGCGLEFDQTDVARSLSLEDVLCEADPVDWLRCATSVFRDPKRSFQADVVLSDECEMTVSVRRMDGERSAVAGSGWWLALDDYLGLLLRHVVPSGVKSNLPSCLDGTCWECRAGGGLVFAEVDGVSPGAPSWLGDVARMLAIWAPRPFEGLELPEGRMVPLAERLANLWIREGAGSRRSTAQLLETVGMDFRDVDEGDLFAIDWLIDKVLETRGYWIDTVEYWGQALGLPYVLDGALRHGEAPTWARDPDAVIRLADVGAYLEDRCGELGAEVTLTETGATMRRNDGLKAELDLFEGLRLSGAAGELHEMANGWGFAEAWQTLLPWLEG